jgi:hypothetical protein
VYAVLAEIEKLLLVEGFVTPALAAESVYVPARLTDRLVNTACPFVSTTAVFVPLRKAPLITGSVRSTETVPPAFFTGLPNLSRSSTTGCVRKIDPAALLLGLLEKSSVSTPADTIVKAPEDTLAREVDVACSCPVPALTNTRSPKVAMPVASVNCVRVPDGVPTFPLLIDNEIGTPAF